MACDLAYKHLHAVVIVMVEFKNAFTDILMLI